MHSIMQFKKQSFDEYFLSIYESRWESIKTAFKSHGQIMRPSFGKIAPPSSQDIFDMPVYQREEHFELLTPGVDGLLPFYIMDPASVICAKALDVQKDSFVLDMCAAPGGKSLILLEKLQSGELWSNEISSARRQKLKSIIQQYVPGEYRDKIFIKGKDGLKYGLQHSSTFDRILVDAPCSGEKHLLNSPKELATWSPKRTKKLAKTQYGLLCSAILACKSDGLIVYSTCSISPDENDAVIERALTKKKDLVCLDLPEFETNYFEKTKYGYMALPDKHGAGPIYFSRLKKIG